MIVRAAMVPHPPLMVPELVVAEVPEVRAPRRSRVAAALSLAQAFRRWIAVTLGSGEVGPHASGTLRGYGVDVWVTLSDDTHGDPDPLMSLPHIGRRLVARARRCKGSMYRIGRPRHDEFRNAESWARTGELMVPFGVACHVAVCDPAAS